jgi:Xaa-Pro aminopeptidase
MATSASGLASDVKDDGADAAVITDPASIAWLFNVRGGDVACTPLPLSSAIIEPSGQATLFINEAKLTTPPAAIWAMKSRSGPRPNLRTG